MITAVAVGAAAGIAASYAGILSIQTSLGPIGWVTAVVTIIIIGILTIAGIGKYRSRTVSFECLPWQAPSGGENCEKCGENGLGCTEYKCKSLGQTCGFLNKGTTNEICVNIAPNDASGPQITLNTSALSIGLSAVNEQNGVWIKNSSASDGCIKEYSTVNFGITLNEAGQCKISTERSPDYESMNGNYFDSSENYYAINHEETDAMPTLDELGESGVDPDRRANYDLYIRCQDGSGNPSEPEYNIRFCVAPADDVTPPRITKFVPESPGVTGLNSTQFYLGFYTNEPASCKWSTTDQNYESMEREATCYNDISQATRYGWLCNAALNVTSVTNQYYFRCADQPWLGEEITESSSTLEQGRNVDGESIGYTVERTTTPLTITSVTPNNQTIYSGVEPVSVTLEVSTSGGIDNGKAFCRFTFSGREIDFAQTSLSNHRQTFTTLFAGENVFPITCTDRAGNAASSIAQFDIVVDNNGPRITRVYDSGNNLQVITNEPATCEYSLSSCSFEFGTGTQLSGLDRSHSMQFNNGITYRIKCRDNLGNIGTCLSASPGY